MKRYITAIFIGICVFLADFGSKYLTQKYFPLMQSYWHYPYGGVGVFRNFLGIEFSLSYQINRGAAWGMFSAYQVPLLYFRLVLIAGILVYLFFFNKHKSWLFPLVLVLAGALGNVLDYFIYGYVIDMLHFVLWGYDFPVFNVADTAIFIGISWLLILSLFEKQTMNQTFTS